MVVEEVPLNITLPDDRIGIVIMQPFVELDETNEPYRWLNDKADKQMARIVRTLEIAKNADHGCAKTLFTIFPEYSIPGLQGVHKIQEILESSSWKDGTIVIGGVDGLTKSEYSTLCNEDMTQVHEENKIENVRVDQWVNCCIIWAKQTNDSLKRWIQPKLSPSWPEKNVTHSRMFAGRSVYLFSGRFENHTECRFLSLICFDWIGPIGTSNGIWAILSEIDNCWRNMRREMNLVFVLQSNPEPNHRNFLENARNYFEIRTEYPFVNRNEGIILFANTAGGSLPGKHQNYGYSALISSPAAPYDNKGCPPTFALVTKKLRGTDSLGGCKEALFREMGACLHSFKFRLPPFVNLGPPARCLPLDEAIIHAVDDGIDDPRTPGKPVPASVKWANDQLDKIIPLLENERVHPLKDNIAKAHRDVSEEIRKQSGDFLCRYIVMSSCEIKKERDKWIKIEEREIHNVDNWNRNEEQSLETVVHSLSIMKVCKPLEIKGSPTHGTVKIQDKVIDIIVVSGKTHEECFKYAEGYLGSGQRFTIVIARDKIGKPLGINWRLKITQPREANSEHGPNITEGRFYPCGYPNLLDCLNSTSIGELESKVVELLEVLK